MLLTLGKFLLKGYVLLLTVTAGGLVGANVASFVPVIVEFASGAQKAPDPDVHRLWVHGGWLVGASLFFAGAAAQRLHSRKAAATGKRVEKKQATPRRLSRRGTLARRCGFFASVGVGSLAGALLGLMLGASLLLLWFSVTYSPFAPAAWPSSVSVETERYPTSGRHRRSVTTTDHPVALYAFCTPIILGATAGELLGGFCGVTVTDGKDTVE